MKLDLFNPWRDLTTWSGITIQYQTAKRGSLFVTYLRDKGTGQPVTLGNGKDKDTSLAAARDALGKIGLDGVKRAIETGQMVHPTTLRQNDSRELPTANPKEPRTDIQWRDGMNIGSRVQRRAMGESAIITNDQI